MVIDHINGDGLDNRRENLREATRAQNMRNLRLRSDNTSQYKGVRRVDAHTWEARVNGQTVGYFDTAFDASFAYDKAALERYGEFAHLNHPLEHVLAWKLPVRQFGKNSASGFRGVQACGDRWSEDAAKAYDRAVIRLKGNRATTNFPLEDDDNEYKEKSSTQP